MYIVLCGGLRLPLFSFHMRQAMESILLYYTHLSFPLKNLVTLRYCDNDQFFSLVRTRPLCRGFPFLPSRFFPQNCNHTIDIIACSFHQPNVVVHFIGGNSLAVSEPRDAPVLTFQANELNVASAKSILKITKFYANTITNIKSHSILGLVRRMRSRGSGWMLWESLEAKVKWDHTSFISFIFRMLSAWICSLIYLILSSCPMVSFSLRLSGQSNFVKQWFCSKTTMRHRDVNLNDIDWCNSLKCMNYTLLPKMEHKHFGRSHSYLGKTSKRCVEVIWYFH